MALAGPGSAWPDRAHRRTRRHAYRRARSHHFRRTAARGSAASPPRNLSRRSRQRQGAFEVRALISRWGSSTSFSGIDHLLFVLALLFLCPGTWRLVKAVTAFTAAHSITLGLATLGLCRMCRRSLEAICAQHRIPGRRDSAGARGTKKHGERDAVDRRLHLRAAARR